MGIYSRPDWLTQDSEGLEHYFIVFDFHCVTLGSNAYEFFVVSEFAHFSFPF